MPGKVAKIGTFSDWIGLFNDWRKEIGVNTKDIEAFHFDTLYGAIDTDEIEFGSYKGRRKWENLRQIPTQQMRDALMNMIVYQGDTEFASVEQQRNLLENAPTDWDRRAITRVMIEEMRHGWQMCALLIDHFGYSGKVEAQKMLERRAFENKRLLGAFNVDVDNWMDFFTYTDFVDRDEVAGLIERFNSSLKPGEPKLYAPHIKFNRAIGRWAGQKFHAQTGEPVEEEYYEEHLKEYMPGPADRKLLLDIIETEKKWIA